MTLQTVLLRLVGLVGLVVLCFIARVIDAVSRGIGSFIRDTTTAVLNGKYISIEVRTLTDAQEVISGQIERQAINWLPNGQGYAGEDITPGTMPGAFETSDDDRTSIDSNSEGVEAQADLADSLADGQTCVGVDSEDPLPVQSETTDASVDQQASVEAVEDEAGGLQSETLETPVDDSDSCTEVKAGVDVEYKSSEQHGVVKELGTPSSRLSRAIVPRRSELPRNVAGVPRRRRARVSRLKKEVGRDSLLQAGPDEQAVVDDVVGLGGDVLASPVTSRIAELSGNYKARIGQLKMTLRSIRGTKERMRRAAGSCVKLERRMTGLVFDTPEQAMIGSDSEAEMEIDDETPVVGNDILAGDPMDLDDGAEAGDPMDVDDCTEGTGDSMDVDESQDGPQSETADTGNSSSASATAIGNSMAPTQVGQRPNATEAGVYRSMDGNQGRNPSKVNQEKLLEKLNREKAELALRQASTNVADNVATTSHTDAALEQSTQEHATPVAAPEAVNTAPGGSGGPPHSAEDLKEARRGKKPETKAVPEEEKIPTPSPAQPVVAVGVQSVSPRVSSPPASSPASTCQSEGNTTSQPDTSDTTSSSAITPTSTLPSSTSSTAPTSPQTTTPSTSDSSPAGSATTDAKPAPKRKVVKRPSDDKKPRANPKKATPNQDQDDQDTPATSSKRSQKTKAIGDQEAQFAAPMTQAEIDAQILEAQFGTQPDSDTDLDWPSDEDEGVETRGRGNREGKEKASEKRGGSAKGASTSWKKDEERKGE